MKRVPLLLALAATAALLWHSATPAQACSVGDFDLVKDSDLIVAGRFKGWELDSELRGAAQAYDPKQTGGLILTYAGIRAKMVVDRVFKGSAPTEITVTSTNTLHVFDHEPQYVWVGPSGACGAFGEDPTNKYAIAGLAKKDDGTYGAFIFSWFYWGTEPSGPKYDSAVARIDDALPQAPTLPFAIAAVGIPLAFVLGASFLFPPKGSRM